VLHDAVNRGHAKTCAFALLFGRVEGLEDVRQVFIEQSGFSGITGNQQDRGEQEEKELVPHT
jgi:hypothetical protein